MPSGSTGGKADGFTTIRGSDIPSQFVDANKSYIIQRNIANLDKVGAFDTVESGLAKRIDGIIANMPADGMLHLAELVRMESPAINNSLFPEEKAALPKLWKLVEAPDANDAVFGLKDNFGVVDGSVPPGAAVPPALLTVASLPTEVQSAASRLENLYNSDGDAATVTLADLANGVANPSAFTQAEVTAFGTIQAIFRDKAVAQADSKLVVSPGPGSVAKDVTLGPVGFHLTGATRFDEQRQFVPNQLSSTLTATQTLAATATIPANGQVLMIDQDSAVETVFPAGTVPGMSGRTFVFEVWVNGQRTFSTNADMPILTSTQTIALNDKLDYTLTSGLTPLIRNLNTTTVSGSTMTAHFTFDTTVIPPTGTVNQIVVQRTATPTVTLPVGRYTFAAQQMALYIYPNNVLWFGRPGSLVRMMPNNFNGNVPTQFVNFQGFQVSFDTTNNVFNCSNCSPSISIQLKSSSRDI